MASSFSLLAYYSFNPGVKDNQTFLCNDLMKANLPKMKYPYLVFLAIFLALGIGLFFVSAIKSNNKKMTYITKWRFVAYVVVGICLSLSFGIIWGRLGKGSEAKWISPSFLDVCKSSDLQHINSLCGNNKNLIPATYFRELEFADLNCLSSEWMVSFSSGYPSFLIAIQTVLLVSSTIQGWHIFPPLYSRIDVYGSTSSNGRGNDGFK